MELYPPEALTEADPSLPPLQETLDTTEHVATNTAGSVIVTEQEAVSVCIRDVVKYKNLQQDL